MNDFVICPCCKQKVYTVPKEEQCEISGCHDFAIYEAWFAVTDFSGNKTGLRQRYRCCEEHVKESIGFKARHTD